MTLQRFWAITYLFENELIPLSLLVFLVGFVGFLTSDDFLDILINLEITMIGLNFYFLSISLGWVNFIAQFFALCFLALTAAETVIGLGFLILLFRVRRSISFTK